MTKEFLRNFRDLNRERAQLHEQLLEMEGRIYSPSGQRLTSTPSSTGTGRTLEDVVAGHLRLAERYESKLAEVERQQIIIEDSLECLSTLERMVIRYRYFNPYMRWEDICEAIPVSWTHVHRLHSSALVKLAALGEK